MLVATNVITGNVVRVKKQFAAWQRLFLGDLINFYNQFDKNVIDLGNLDRSERPDRDVFDSGRENRKWFASFNKKKKLNQFQLSQMAFLNASQLRRSKPIR